MTLRVCGCADPCLLWVLARVLCLAVATTWQLNVPLLAPPCGSYDLMRELQLGITFGVAQAGLVRRGRRDCGQRSATLLPEAAHA